MTARRVLAKGGLSRIRGCAVVLVAGTTLEDFFGQARMNPNAALITGVLCGVRVETIDDPLMQQIRYMDKLVDELAKGKALEKVLRA